MSLATGSRVFSFCNAFHVVIAQSPLSLFGLSWLMSCELCVHVIGNVR